MAVQIRKRRRQRLTNTGTRTHIPTGAVSTSRTYNQDYIEDVAGLKNLANYLFLSNQKYKKVGTISGKALAFPTYKYDNYPYLNQGAFSHLPAVTVPPSNSVAVTLAAARTNPSSPVVSIPVFLAELKDFPRSLQRYGNNKRHAQAEGSSSADFNFGWDLLFRDVAKMFQFTDQVNRRIKQLTAAHGVGGSRGRVVVWSDHASQVTTDLTVWSLEAYKEVTQRKSTYRKMWASVRWLADSPNVPPADQVLFQAKTSVHGWRLSPADAWQILPWSWFIDYFVNVGDFLEANSNSLGIHYDRGCVMLETVTNVQHELESGSTPGFTFTPASWQYRTRERTPATPSLGVYSVPFLGPKQLVTLSSIVSANRKYK